MTYGGVVNGTFTNVYDNGFLIPATDVHYSGNLVTVSTATFTGFANWIGANGSWNTNTNWTDGASNGVPGNGLQGLGHDTASFSGSSAVTTITLDISPNIAALSFSNSNYTISNAGTGTLTLQGGTAGGGTSTVTVANGTQAIAANVMISGGSLAVAINGGGSLAIGGNITDDNGHESLTLSG